MTFFLRYDHYFVTWQYVRHGRCDVTVCQAWEKKREKLNWSL